MISKETFVNIMNRLQTLNDNMDAANMAFKKLSPDFCGFFIPEVFNMVIDVLNEIFEDKEDWYLEYCIYELDFLRSFKMGDVISVDGDPIDLSTWEKVYDFLIENMEE